MSITVHLRRFCVPLLSVLLCGALASASLAIPMKVTIGFDGAAKSFFWTPVAVELSNTSDNDIEGTVSVLQPELNMPYLSSCSARVSLPAHSKKLYHSYARLASYGNVTVLFSRGNAVHAIRKLPVDAVSKGDAMVVSVGARSTRLNFLNGEMINRTQRYSSQQGGSPGPSQATIRVGSIHQSNLPDRPSAYESVDLLILSDLTPASVNPKALKALAMWVASGGTLVVPTGPNYRNFQNEFYDDLLPVKIVGAANLPGMPSLSPLGRSPFPEGAVSVSKGALKPGVGRALASESGVPVIAERDYGAGKVIFLAFDHLGSPFKDWNGQAVFWKEIMLKTPPPKPMAISTVSMFDESDFQNQYPGSPYQAQRQGGMVGLVVRNPAVKAPSFNSIGLFLIAYLVALAPVNYFVLKRRKRLELAWVTTPAVVLLFTVGAYAIGYTMKGSDLRLRQATMIEASSGARYASAVTNASLFSPSRRSYDLEADDPYALSQAIPGKSTEQIPSGYLDEKCTLENVAMAMWSSRAFESVSGVDLGGAIKSDLTLTGRQITGQVRNDTQVPLTACVVYYAGRSVKIADLPKGGTAKVDISYTAKPSGRPSPRGAPQPDDLAAGLYDYAGTLALAAGNPVLVARPALRGGVFNLIGRRASTSASVCCVFRLAYETSGAFSVAPNSISQSIVRSNNASVQATGCRPGSVRFNMWGGGGLIVVAFQIAMPVGSRATSLLLTAQGSGPDGMKNLEVSARNWKTGQFDTLNVLSGGVALDPASHLNEGREARIRVRHMGGAQRIVTLGITAAGTRL